MATRTVVGGQSCNTMQLALSKFRSPSFCPRFAVFAYMFRLAHIVDVRVVVRVVWCWEVSRCGLVSSRLTFLRTTTHAQVGKTSTATAKRQRQTT